MQGLSGFEETGLLERLNEADADPRVLRALLIRKTEERFLSLFSEGRLNGTVHTCLGQELTAVAFAGALRDGDFIVSNHRCHGHYIAFTGRYDRLIAELMGKRTGVCGGVGSSQHLFDRNFYSNGVQGGIVPVAAGLAFARKLSAGENIGVVFIGDGTLGEGVVYETLNIVSKWCLPLLVVCEHNGWAQSTKADDTLAGDVLARARGFGLAVAESDVWHEEDLFSAATASIATVRDGTPLFHLVRGYRLGPHSKGDDNRNPSEIDSYKKRDRLSNILTQHAAVYDHYSAQIEAAVETAVEAAADAGDLTIDEYNTEPRHDRSNGWLPLEATHDRVVDSINRFFREELVENERSLFIGEDVLSPYGGAFKVARDLSQLAPDRVITTPISELGIVGIGNGLALGGYRPYIEIMFGDFVTLAFDQLVNHASKFRHMYDHQTSCPVVVRTPMGGHRGYGPTHSQSLERFIIGIENVRVVALNALLEPRRLYADVALENDPVVVIENKIDYGRRLDQRVLQNYVYEAEDARYPIVRVRPRSSSSDVAIVTFGGMSETALRAAERLFTDHEILASILVLAQIHPLQTDRVVAALDGVRSVISAEEGNPFAGFGAELIAELVTRDRDLRVNRVGALPVPIPSTRLLEESVLPGVDRVVDAVLAVVR